MCRATIFQSPESSKSTISPVSGSTPLPLNVSPVQFSYAMEPGGPEWANGASGRLKACSVRCKRVLRTSISPPLHEFRALLRSSAPTGPFQEPGFGAVPFQFSVSVSSVSVSVSVQFSSVQLCNETGRARVGQTAPLGGSRRVLGGANGC